MKRFGNCRKRFSDSWAAQRPLRGAPLVSLRCCRGGTTSHGCKGRQGAGHRVPAAGVPAIWVPAVGVPATGVPAVGVPAVGVLAVGCRPSGSAGLVQRASTRQHVSRS